MTFKKAFCAFSNFTFTIYHQKLSISFQQTSLTLTSKKYLQQFYYSPYKTELGVSPTLLRIPEQRFESFAEVFCNFQAKMILLNEVQTRSYTKKSFETTSFFDDAKEPSKYNA
ncbi:hypothetical protein BH11BAC2_BH11BAC2_20440 [soil metagenome]